MHTEDAGYHTFLLLIRTNLAQISQYSDGLWAVSSELFLGTNKTKRSFNTGLNKINKEVYFCNYLTEIWVLSKKRLQHVTRVVLAS